MLAFIVGLKAEARLVGPGACIGGGTRRGALDAAARAIASGATALVSFGLAGGLSPALAAGALVCPERVINASGSHVTDLVLSRALAGTTCRAVFGGAAVAATETAKAALWSATGAEIIDLESGAVAEAAAAAGLPFAVLRAVCDPAWRTLPPAALLALDAAGAILPWRVAGSLIRRPAQIPALLGLARDAAAARHALKRHMASLHAGAALAAWD